MTRCKASCTEVVFIQLITIDPSLLTQGQSLRLTSPHQDPRLNPISFTPIQLDLIVQSVHPNRFNLRPIPCGRSFWLPSYLFCPALSVVTGIRSQLIRDPSHSAVLLSTYKR